MNNICTSLEQSKKLIELGINIDTADMRYAPFGDTHPWILNNDLIEKDSTPCWSLTALMNLLDDKAGLAKEYGLWYCYDNGKSYRTKHYQNQIDAAFEIVVWLLENNKLENNKIDMKPYTDIEQSKKLAEM